MRDSDEIIAEIENELKVMVKIPTESLSMRAQQAEESISAQHVMHCVYEMLDNQNYLLDRLKHSETERFSSSHIILNIRND